MICLFSRDFVTWLTYFHVLFFSPHMNQFTCDSFAHFTWLVLDKIFTWFISLDSFVHFTWFICFHIPPTWFISRIFLIWFICFHMWVSFTRFTCFHVPRSFSCVFFSPRFIPKVIFSYDSLVLDVIFSTIHVFSRLLSHAPPPPN